jgi:hypothetical protein
MKAYLNAKCEAAKSYLITSPERLKAWPGKKWESTKHTLKTTDWPLTITIAIGWGVKNSIIGFLLGMGVFGLLAEFVLWDVLQDKQLPNDPVSVDIVYGYLTNYFLVNALSGASGSLAYLVMNLHKLKLYRRLTIEHFMALDDHPEATQIVREAMERKKKKPA